MQKLSTNTKTDLFIHFGILIASFLILFFAFFFFFLPWVTNHGEAITVPNLKGMTLDQMEDALDEKDLAYEISDTTFVTGLKPLSIHSHYPKAGEQVKSKRKIYLTIIAGTAPMVAVPDVVGRSSNSAKNLLISMGFAQPRIEFIPAIEKNTVLKLKDENGEFTPGKKLSKGSVITLVVGDGFGNTDVEIPDLVGMPLDEAEILISGMGLSIGSVLFDVNSTNNPGTITRQRPDPSEGTLKTGNSINIWVAGNENTEGIPSIK